MTLSHTTHTLLATTGASPQVITETLYAIHHENQPWPDDIYLITTSFGKGKALKGLIEEGQLQRLCDEIQRLVPAFGQQHILVSPGADGSEVEDARSLADHEALANFIMATVRDFTTDDSRTLHASLAGGRKTMTFYIGYAMSLFGRVQDTLSHVLISDGYEGLPDFWFPTTAAEHRHLSTRDGTKLDASKAKVTLAPIPFVRHRSALPAILLQSNKTLDFAQLVRLINWGETPKEIFLHLDLLDRHIAVLDAQNQRMAEIRLGELELAFYAMVVRASQKGRVSIARPPKKTEDAFLSDCILEEMQAIYNLKIKDGLQEGTPERRQALLGALVDSDRIKLKPATEQVLQAGITSSFFDQRINAIKESFATHLPKSVSRWLLPTVVWEETEEGTQRLGSERVDNTSKGGGYGIFLDAGNITIKDA